MRNRKVTCELFFQRFNAYKYHWSDTRLPVVLEVSVKLTFVNVLLSNNQLS